MLVYNGPEIVHSSFNAVLSSLRTLLLSHYVVQPVEHHVLAKQPWSLTCALLVFPRLSQPFGAPARHQVQDYVDRGGALLALGAGATCSTRGIVAGIDQLSLGAGTPNINSSFSFFDKFNNADICPLFGVQPSKPALVDLKSVDGDTVRAIYEASRADFTGFEGERGVKVLGKYIGDDGQEGKIAGLGCDIGGGRIAFWSPDLDQCLIEEPATTLVSSLAKDDPVELDKGRRKLLRRTLLYLGLQLPATLDSDDEPRPIARPFPQFLVSSPDKPNIVSQIIDALSDVLEPNDEDPDKPRILKGTNDTFHFHESDSANALLLESKALLPTESDPSTWQPKRIIIHRNGTLPSKIYTSPYFDLDLFFQCLSSYQSPSSVSKSQKSEKWPIGSALFFSPAVTSTQTLLDKNPTFLSSLPTPIVSVASHQLSGRGRGSNVWLSPSGSLSYSIHLRLTTADGVPWSKLVFVQYLFALAVCEGVRDDSVLGRGGDEQEGVEGEGWRVKIKWPNDVYALVGPRGQEEKKKVAGILVSTNFGSKGVDIVIGVPLFTWTCVVCSWLMTSFQDVD